MEPKSGTEVFCRDPRSADVIHHVLVHHQLEPAGEKTRLVSRKTSVRCVSATEKKREGMETEIPCKGFGCAFCAPFLCYDAPAVSLLPLTRRSWGAPRLGVNDTHCAPGLPAPFPSTPVSSPGRWPSGAVGFCPGSSLNSSMIPTSHTPWILETLKRTHKKKRRWGQPQVKSDHAAKTSE